MWQGKLRLLVTAGRHSLICTAAIPLCKQARGYGGVSAGSVPYHTA